MFQLAVLSTLALAIAASGEKAPAVNDNPTNVVAVAHFPQTGELRDITGTMKFFSTNGTVKVHWDVTKLPNGKGPFYYHIHEFPIGDSSSCETAGRHLNPYKAPPECDKVEDDSYCQVGDLSGKHGFIDTTCYETSYYDSYLSLKDGPAQIIGKSVVLHYPNLQKIACADIKVSDETPQAADLESKRNILHNKDLVEAKDPNWKPANEQEATLIEEAHKEWLKYNNEGDVHHDEYQEEEEEEDYSEAQDEADEEQDEEVETEEAEVESEESEAEAEEVDETQNGQKVQAVEDDENEVESEVAEETSSSTKLDESDCENSAPLLEGFDVFTSLMAAALGVLI